MKLGCNYWASNAGTEMWVQWAPDVIRKDLQTLKAHGVGYLRVFPNWRDFQPVVSLYGGQGTHVEYRLSGDRFPENEDYLDEEMLQRFDVFCDLCQEHGIRLIVGLLTGWMSGRLFLPPALEGKDLCTDPVCLYFEQKFISGFVKRFKHKKAIYAWDHGNECHCMVNAANQTAASAWVNMLSNAVYAQDRSHPLISGFNYLTTGGIWTIEEQAHTCDQLVTHPYPYWSDLAKSDCIGYLRTTHYPMALTKIYADISGKPCMIEEIGTMGPSVCAEDRAAAFLNAVAFSALANGCDTVLWWCAHDQSKLMTAPYTWANCENELGMIDACGKPKPVLQKMGELAQIFEGLPFQLPPAQTDAVCLLTQDQDDIGVGVMTYILAKQASLNLAFADAGKPLPEADVYLVPSITGMRIMPKERWLTLLERVAAGATLYISHNGGIIMDFEAVTGNRILDTEYSPYGDTLTLNGMEIPYTAPMRLITQCVEAEPIQTPLITRHRYGKGTVLFVNLPVEAMLIYGKRRFDQPTAEIYRTVFHDLIDRHMVRISNPNVALTLHANGQTLYAIAINHSEQEQDIHFETDCRLIKVHYGDPTHCQPMDAVIVEFCQE